MLEFAERLESTPLGLIVRESTWVFPTLVALHLLSLGFSVGMVLWLDLRLLGISMPGVRVSEVYRRLMPWALPGFAAMFASGACLLIGYASAAYANPYFRVKALALTLAGLNAFFYHAVTARRSTECDELGLPPFAARLAGGVSIVLWAIVVVAGRMMSYTMF